MAAQLVVNGVVALPAVKFTTEVVVNPLPFTVKFVMSVAVELALAVKGAMEVMPNAA